MEVHTRDINITKRDMRKRSSIGGDGGRGGSLRFCRFTLVKYDIHKLTTQEKKTKRLFLALILRKFTQGFSYASANRTGLTSP